MSEETEQAELEELIVVNLKYSYRNRSHKQFAIAEIVAKVLYAIEHESVSLKVIRKRIRGVLGVQVDEAQIRLGIAVLESDNHVLKTGKLESRNEQWVLTPQRRKAIRKELQMAEQELEDVLGRHFPKDIDGELLKTWFRDVSADFFGHFGTQWLATINKGIRFQRPRDKRISDFTARSTEKHDLGSRRTDLEQAYGSFLSSDNTKDLSLLMNLGLAMFSARLVAAGVGVDPLTLEELKGGKFILDTNFLLEIKFMRKNTRRSLKALGEALREIDAKLVYTRWTMDEYRRVIESRRQSTLYSLEHYGSDVLDAATDDDFLQCARELGYNSEDEIEKYFSDLRDLPSELVDGLPIALEEDDKVDQQGINAQKDLRLKSIIEQTRQRVTGQPARPRPVEHDLALLYIVRFLREDEGKCWILSYDRVLQSVALDGSPASTMPLVLSLEALIEMLAVNNAGPSFKPTIFAPLLANILRNHSIPPTNSFNTKDLEALHNLYQDVATLPKENVIPLVRQINRVRTEGKSLDDPRVQASIATVYRQEMKSYNEEKNRLESENSRLNSEMSEKRRELADIAASSAHYRENALKMKKRELKWRYRRELAKDAIPRVIIAGVITALISFMGGHYLPQFGIDLLSLLSAVVQVYLYFKEPIAEFRQKLGSLDKNAQEEIDSEL